MLMLLIWAITSFAPAVVASVKNFKWLDEVMSVLPPNPVISQQAPLPLPSYPPMTEEPQPVVTEEPQPVVTPDPVPTPVETPTPEPTVEWVCPIVGEGGCPEPTPAN